MVMFGGKFQLARPVWMPVNTLLIRRTANLLPVLRGRLQGRMPHWFGKVHGFVRGR